MKQLNLNTPIVDTDAIVLDFWAWAYSDILSNRNRGIFAEFLVGHALDVLGSSARIEWEGYDLEYHNHKIEVKSSAYLQSWFQSKLSKIRFDIGSKKTWDSTTNTFSEETKRFSDYYVFCLFTPKDMSQANVLDTNLWEFYVVPTITLNQHHPDQKTIGLGSIAQLTDMIAYRDIRSTVDKLVDK